MPRATLLSLPLEIHCEILKYVRCSAQKTVYFDSDDSEGLNDDNIIVGWKWIEEDKGKFAQFPYNAAAVCQLWLDILAKIPECWTRVIIDVADDPSRFLDVFLWSKDLPKLDVTVFNSRTPDPQDVEYSLPERERVSAIVNALLPHTSRCESVTINVAFMTSLPSLVVFLINDIANLCDLILECKIDNAGSPDDFSHSCELGVRKPIPTPSSFPLLRTLSITGFWFMFVSGHPHTSKQFKKFCLVAGPFECRISHFKFQKDGQYTLRHFVRYCSAVKPLYLTLSDLALDHNVPTLEGESGDEYDDHVFSSLRSVIFKNVSADVIQSLFVLASISPADLTFDNCALPSVIMRIAAQTLHLKNMPCSTILADSDPRKDSTNFATILQNWSGISLNVVSCPSFDDTVLSNLPGYKASTLITLCLDDCDNFTVRGIQEYLRKRNTQLPGVPDRYYHHNFGHLHNLVIYGTTCPFPSEEEQEWFRTNDCATPTAIQWKLRDPADLTRNIQEFTKHGEHN